MKKKKISGAIQVPKLLAWATGCPRPGWQPWMALATHSWAQPAPGFEPKPAQHYRWVSEGMAIVYNSHKISVLLIHNLLTHKCA